ncbi:SRPBCC domain-containing protein [Pontibacter saemangeumensis]|uniref:SRPBCC domain-containing protein n=2 Tax=Pontibacter saemangeumensis TaxID=1084525 RepID=A0ABP8LKZ9_9BACT
MDFSVDKENKAISVKREFAAALPLVWEAYTKSEILDQWWAPKPWRARTKAMDFREGGYWLYAMVGPGGEEHWARADYLKIDPHKSFSARDGFADEEGNLNRQMPQSRWDVAFSSAAVGTLVTNRITFGDLQHLEQTLAMGFKEGFVAALENLDGWLSRR